MSSICPAPSPGDHLGRQPIKSKSIKQTPCWLLPSFSDLSQEAHIPSWPTWVQANAFVGRSEKGPQDQESIQRTLTRPPGSCDIGLYNLIPAGEGEGGGYFVSKCWERGTRGKDSLFCRRQAAGVIRSVKGAAGKEGYNLRILPVNQVMKVAVSLSHAI